MSGPPKIPNQVHANAIWQEALMNENKYAAIWEDNWGFLKHDKLDTLVKKGFDSVKPAVAHNNANSIGKDFDQSRMTGTVDSSAKRHFDSAKHCEARTRYILNSTKTPKEKVVAPATTAQELGWRNSLELFGTNQYGIKRDKTIIGPLDIQ